MDHLNDECLRNIFNYLPTKDILLLASSSKNLQSLVIENFDHILTKQIAFINFLRQKGELVHPSDNRFTKTHPITKCNVFPNIQLHQFTCHCLSFTLSDGKNFRIANSYCTKNTHFSTDDKIHVNSSFSRKKLYFWLRRDNNNEVIVFDNYNNNIAQLILPHTQIIERVWENTFQFGYYNDTKIYSIETNDITNYPRLNNKHEIFYHRSISAPLDYSISLNLFGHLHFIDRKLKLFHTFVFDRNVFSQSPESFRLVKHNKLLFIKYLNKDVKPSLVVYFYDLITKQCKSQKLIVNICRLFAPAISDLFFIFLEDDFFKLVYKKASHCFIWCLIDFSKWIECESPFKCHTVETLLYQ